MRCVALFWDEFAKLIARPSVYLVFLPSSPHGVSKILGISWVLQVTGAYFAILHMPLSTTWGYTKVTFSGPLDSFRIRGWLAEEPAMWLEGWNLQSYPRISGEGEGEEIEWINQQPMI